MLIKWLVIVATILVVALIEYVRKKKGILTPYEKRLRKKWEEEKAAEEDARTEQQQERRHYMSQAEYEQYKREHGIK